MVIVSITKCNCVTAYKRNRVDCLSKSSVDGVGEREF